MTIATATPPARATSAIAHLASALALSLLLLGSGTAEALTPPAKSPEEAAQRAKQQVGGGRVLGIHQQQRDGQHYYDVKVLSSGKVRVLRIRGDRQ